MPPALTDTHRLLLAHAAKVTAHEGWFPEFDFNGRMKRPLETLVTRGMLERRAINRAGMVRDSWPTAWYRVPRTTGADVPLPPAMGLTS